MQNMRRVFLVHGWEGNPENHWFPWLRRELSENGFAVFSLAMANTNNPKLSEWLGFLSRSVVSPDKDTYFVGHSLGCITIARYLASLPKGVEVGGCVFVAGFSGNLGIPEIAEFCSSPLDFDAVRSHAHSIATVYSDTDEYVPLAESEDFTKKLHAIGILEKGKGHFSSELQPQEIPSVLSSLLKFADHQTLNPKP